MTRSLRFSYLFLAATALIILPELAAAANSGMDFVTDKLCNIIKFLTGGIGKAIAVLAIVILGVGAFFGKVNWGLAVTVTVGIIGIFGAFSIIEAVGSNATGSGSTQC